MELVAIGLIATSQDAPRLTSARVEHRRKMEQTVVWLCLVILPTQSCILEVLLSQHPDSF